MLDISPVQIAIVLLIALLVFGPRRLPELGRGLGSGIRDFKRGLSGEPAPRHEGAGAVTADAAAADAHEPRP